MCTLTALLPAEVGHALYERIDATARAAHDAEGEYRTMPQLRADALAQAVLDPAAASAPGSVSDDLTQFVKAEIVVHIPAATLLGASDDVAELEGYGVIDAHTARELAAAAPTWNRLFTDPHGTPVGIGRTAYRPPAALRRFIRYRDGTCVVPGCTRGARRCEVDHVVEWQDGGTTDPANLALLCPKHHALKSLALFTLHHEAAENQEAGEADTSHGGEAALDGDLVWTTLLGYEHPAEPIDRDHIFGLRPDLDRVALWSKAEEEPDEENDGPETPVAQAQPPEVPPPF